MRLMELKLIEGKVRALSERVSAISVMVADASMEAQPAEQAAVDAMLLGLLSSAAASLTLAVSHIGIAREMAARISAPAEVPDAE